MALPSTHSPSPAPRPARKRRAPSPSTPKEKKKRGGQRGNQNARKLGAYSRYQPGPLSEIRARITSLSSNLLNSTKSPDEMIAEARSIRAEIPPISAEPQNDDILTITRLQIRLFRFIDNVAKLTIPFVLRQRAMESIASDSLGFFKRDYMEYWCIGRDADSFFIVSQKSARNSNSTPILGLASPDLPNWSEVPANHPHLATNLTDEQWAVLAPLIPPDPWKDWLSGQPPVIIAANRWRLSNYSPTGDFNDFVVMQEHNEILQRFPALQQPTYPEARKKRGRPRNPPVLPRAMLDAILWKLATGHTWDELPDGLPPSRLCRKYYRRLFLSGRLYTLLLALHNHMCLEAVIDPYQLLEEGVFTTTSSQSIALAPGVPQTWQNYTALLFMQLAREAYSRAEREAKRNNPYHPLLPLFKGEGQSSTAILPDIYTPQQPSFLPLEQSFAFKKWDKSRKTAATVDRIVKQRLKNPSALSLTHQSGDQESEQSE